jgi:purine-binding chemotaxis protein CheW
VSELLPKITSKTSEAQAERQVVVFRLAEGHYALDIQSVQEIVRMQEISIIPEADPCVVGVTNLRDRTVPVLDLRRRCGAPETPQTPDTRIVVVGSERGLVGLMVDAVSEVLRLSGGQVDAPSDIVREERNAYVTGVARLKDRLICLLDLSMLVTTRLPEAVVTEMAEAA